MTTISSTPSASNKVNTSQAAAPPNSSKTGITREPKTPKNLPTVLDKGQAPIKRNAESGNTKTPSGTTKVEGISFEYAEGEKRTPESFLLKRSGNTQDPKARKHAQKMQTRRHGEHETKPKDSAKTSSVPPAPASKSDKSRTEQEKETLGPKTTADDKPSAVKKQ